MRIAKAFIIVAAVVGGSFGALSIGAAVAQSTSSPVLVLNLQKLRQESPAWADMATKLRALLEQKSNEYRAQNQAAAQAVETEGRALQPLLQGKTQAELMANTALKTRYDTQVRRERDLQQKQQIFEYSVRATTETADRQLLSRLDPIIDQIMTQRGAVVVLDQSVTLKGRPAIDITTDAATRFNAATPTAPQPVWTPITVAPEGAGQPKAATKK